VFVRRHAGPSCIVGTPMRYDVWPGTPYPLGATFDGRGVNFAVASHHATSIDVCLFDEETHQREVARLPLVDCTHHVFHGYVPGLAPGTVYGLRAHGPWAPQAGHRFNANKLLVDPYAKALVGRADLAGPVVGHRLVDTVEQPDGRDSAASVPKALVTAEQFDWSHDRRPEVLWRKAVIYELHVKGFTQQHPDIPERLRGTYLGLAHPAALEYLTQLGVTSVELLPVHESVSEGFLSAKGLTNYWGYNTLGFFAPDQRFASSRAPGAAVREFKTMVLALHQAGIEVLLDVVYNHTCEGNHLGPTLSWRGLDNYTFYRLDPSNPARYRDSTGCGNTVDVSHSQVLKFVLDSLRHWVTEYHVDGFRFDLATALGRTGSFDFDQHSDFFAAVHQDPVLSRVKLIAEPWDVGDHGYRLGQFPVSFAEWNDAFRTTARKFWKGVGGLVPSLAYRLSGSSDFFKASGRRPSASINYVACHDGFTLHDVTAYAGKHNEANLENNRDGANENDSFNHGVEGATDDASVMARREKTQRNLLATLFLSLGTPMLNMGDEVMRTQGGNNNAYCQDGPLSWQPWQLSDAQRRMLAFTRRLVELRRAEPVLQRRNFFQGSTLEDSRFRDAVWFGPGGRELTSDDWQKPGLTCLGLFLGGDAIATRTPVGQKVAGDSLLLYFHQGSTPLEVTLPGPEWGPVWRLLLDTSTGDEVVPRHIRAAQPTRLPESSVTVWAPG
jgi:isoamylase